MHKSGGSLTQSSLLLTGRNLELGICQSDHQSDADDERVVSFDVKP